MPHKKYVHQPTILKDIAIIVVVNMVLLFLFFQIDLLEWVYEVSRAHEEYELDELLPLSASITISLLFFSYRRIKELGKMAQALEEMALLDVLSGLSNRRAGQISLASWCQSAEKNQQPFVFYQISIDDFYNVNELYGHDIGDEVIQKITQQLLLHKPHSARVFRWLEDSFVMMTPFNKNELPHELIQKMQKTINNKIMPSILSLTCSIGYTVWEAGQTPNDILYEAENDLMAIKYGTPTDQPLQFTA